MSSDMRSVIAVEGLGKCYRIRHGGASAGDALREWISAGMRGILRGGSTTVEETFWALQDLSFSLSAGEQVGVVGRNGAGKSTLLKILSRITEPTRGRVRLRGAVTSLLEVGTGFHPELTGRENVFLNGAILGMRHREVRRRFDQIVEFAGVERFLDTPVKYFSSGMYSRLAFAVAAHLDGDILIVDEVLSVGDAAFQQRCLGKMGELAGSGRAVLFVSHNLAAVKALCHRALLIDQGRLVQDGATPEVLATYLASGAPDADRGFRDWSDSPDQPGCDDFALLALSLHDVAGFVSASHDIGQPLEVRIRYRVRAPLRNLRLILKVKTHEGLVAFASTDHAIRGSVTLQPGDYLARCVIPPNLFNETRYCIDIACHQPGDRVLLQGGDFLCFSARGRSAHGSTYPEAWPGVIAPALHWQTDISVADEPA